MNQMIDQEYFLNEMPKTMKSLFKNIDLFTQDDITTLSLGFNTKPTNSLIQDTDKANDVQAINCQKYPPSIICKFCNDLM